MKRVTFSNFIPAHNILMGAIIALVSTIFFPVSSLGATVDELTTISKNYVFIADNITSNGTVQLTANTLYDEGRIFAPSNNSVASNKGSITFDSDHTSHKNSLRLKNTADKLCFKVSAPCRVKFYSQSHNSRGIQVGSTDGGTEYGSQTASTTSWSCDITSAGIVYLSSYGGDFYFAGFEVTFKPATPTYTLGDWNEGSNIYSVTLSCTTPSSTIHYSTDNKANYSDYSGELSLAPGTTLDAYATVTDWSQSDNMTQYTVPAAPSSGTVETPTVAVETWDPESGNYIVTLSCATEGATIKYSTDNKSSYSDYTTALSLAPGATLDAYALKGGMDNSENMEQHIVAAAPTSQAATPSYTLGAWDATNRKYSVTLACTTENSTIKYSTDGKANYSEYTEALSLAPGTTLDAYAYAANMLKSADMVQYTVVPAPPTTIPQTGSVYLDWNDATITGNKKTDTLYKLESTKNGTTATFLLNNTASTPQDFIVTFKSGLNNNHTTSVALTLYQGDSTDPSNKIGETNTIPIQYNGTWNATDSHYAVFKNVPSGTLTFTFEVSIEDTGNAGNYYNLAFYNDVMPLVGESTTYLDVTKIIGTGSTVPNYNSNGYAGNIKNGSVAEFTVKNANESTHYKMLMDIERKGAGSFKLSIIDIETGNTDVNEEEFTIDEKSSGFQSYEFPLTGSINPGYKIIKYEFVAGTGNTGYIANFKNVTFAVDNTASVTGITAKAGEDALTVTAGTGDNDWTTEVAAAYSGDVNILPAVHNGTISSVTYGSNNTAVTAETDGSYNIPAPDAGESVTVTINITANSGYSLENDKSSYKLLITKSGFKLPTPEGQYIDLSKGTYTPEGDGASIRYSSNDTYGYIVDNMKVKGVATYTDAVCGTAGSYSMTFDIRKYDGTNTVKIEILNSSDQVESSTNYTWTTATSGYQTITIPLEGALTTGNKTVKLTFIKDVAGSSPNICNFANLRFDLDNSSSVTGVTAAGGLTVTEGTAEGDPDWKIDVPADYEGANVTFTPAVHHGTIVVKQGETTLTATDGAYSITTPEPGESATINITLTPTDNTYTAAKTEYTLSISRGGFKLPTPTGQYVNLSKGTYTPEGDGASIRYSSNDTYGYIVDNMKVKGIATYTDAVCGTAGSYSMTLDIRKYDGTNTMKIEILNSSNQVESSTNYTWTTGTSSYQTNTIPLEGALTTGNKTVKLTFTKDVAGESSNICNFANLRFDLAHKLTIGATSNGSVALTSPAGAITDSNGKYAFAEGTSVTLTATPAEGYKVKAWKNGDTTISGETGLNYTYQMGTSDVTISAEFELGTQPAEQFKLTLGDHTNGTMAITSPTGATPGTDGKYTFENGTEITLKATPNRRYKLDKWTNGSNQKLGDKTTLTYTLTGDITINAIFVQKDEPTTTITIPTTGDPIDLTAGLTEGAISYKAETNAMESIKDGGNVAFKVNAAANCYDMKLKMKRYAGANKLNIAVFDNTGVLESETDYGWAEETKDYEEFTIPMNGTLTAGTKIIELTFLSEGTGYICNFKDLRFAANNAGMVTSVTSTSDEVTIVTEETEEEDDVKWVMTVPAEPENAALAANVTFTPQKRNGNLTNVYATQDGDPVVVTGPDGSGNYSVPTPDYGKETVVTIEFHPNTIAAARGFTRAAGDITYTMLIKRGGVTLPTTAGKAINLDNGVLTGSGALQKEGTLISDTRNDTKYALLLNNPTAQDYYLSFQTGSKYDNIILNVKVSKNDGSATYLDKDITLTNTGGWDPKTTYRYKLVTLPVGLHKLEVSVKQKSGEGNECGNWGNFSITKPVYDDIPGTVKLENGVLNGTIRNQKDDNGNITNVGYVRKNDTATYPLKCTKAGVYEMAMKIYPYKDCTMNIVVKHEDTGVEEVNMNYPITKKAGNKVQAIMLDGELTTGAKLMTFTFKYDGTDNPNLLNYEAPVFTHKADHLATIAGVSVTGQTVTKGTNTDWYVELPETMSNTNVTFTPDVKYGKVSIKAKQDDKDVSVKDNNDDTFTVKAPDASHSMNLTMTIKPNTGAIAARDEFTMRMLRLGPVSLSKIEIDGISIDDQVLADLNKNATATHKAVYTVLPEVKALVISGDSATISEPVVSGTKATYTITGKIGSKTKNFTLVVEGMHIYEAQEGDGVIPLLYTVEGRNDDKTTWSDGLYTVESAKIDGWGSGRFKFNSDFSTLVLPSDVVVKRMVLKELKANSKSAKANAELTSVTSDGATVWMPAKHTYAYGDDNQYDLVLTIDNHKPSAPIMFKFTGGGQPVAWIELVVQYVNPHTAPEIRNVTITPTDKKNHCVVAVTFDRQMQATTINMGGKQVTAEEGGILYFPFWDLEFNKNYTFKLPAGTAKDKYGNTNGTGYETIIKVGPKPAFDKVPYDYVVSSIQELREAIAAVNMSNEEADAERKVIFIRNGSYYIGSDVKGPDYDTNSKDITRQAEELNLNAYNVSLIGESMTGVDLHGERTGISYPILQINNTSGNYMQDLTVTNNWDFDKPRDGVAVAISGGKRAIFNRVRMRSQQDTQVTGESSYYLNCEIYGAVDYICGSGNHYYDNCNLLMTNPGPITAPSTLSTQKWGYVFQNCTIDAADGAVVGDSDYSLGRPWKNEPSAYYLNTHMLIEPAKEGWSAMGELKTHFYEYNSLNANGEAIDLSVRQNSPTSLNTYTPVLTADEAKKFTVRNVLGTTDSWLPTEDTYETNAVKLSLDNTILSWSEADSVRCYVIFRDGRYYDNVVSNVYRATEDGEYTIRTANMCGGLGKASNMVIVTGLATGIEDRPFIEEEETGEVRYYSLSGMQLSQPQKGINIMVIKTSQGYKSKKVIIK